MTEPPSPHLSDEALNEYLDAALGDMARAMVEAHLAVCPSCSARCASLRAVFAGLAALPQAPLARDLGPRVMAAVRRRGPASGHPLADPRRPAFRLIFAVQTLVALGLFAFAWPFLASLALPVPAPTFGDLNALLARLAGASLDPGILLPRLQGWLAVIVAQPALPSSVSLPPIAAAALLATAGGFWLLGNTLLLRPRVAPTSRRNS